MPILSNSKHHKFAVEVRKGATVSEACAIASISLKKCSSLPRAYVYLLVDPRDDRLFYVGKGTRYRHTVHWQAMLKGHVHNVAKHSRLADIAAAGLRVQELCFDSNLSDDGDYQIEQALIRTIGFKVLTNILPGIDTTRAQAGYKAMKLLHRVMFFEDWIIAKSRSIYEIGLYWNVVQALEKQCGLRDLRIILA